MLGFEGAWGAECCAYYGTGDGQIWLNQANCIGDEASIAECRHGGWGNHQCTHFDDVGVTCKYTPPPTPDTLVRLVDGPNANEGRVEVFHDGYWGTICDDLWDIRDADVVCRELNFSRALSAPRMAAFGEGNGHIWFDDTECFGNESSIVDCSHGGWDSHNCRHLEDAAVVCEIEGPSSYG